MLKPKELSPESLLLDPNNPRLTQNFQSQGYVKDEEAEDNQDALLSLFKKSGQGHEFTDIEDLKKSIKQIGFVRIQNIVVREI